MSDLLKQEFLSYREKTGNSFEQIAKQIGNISSSALNLWVSDKYNGKVEVVEKKVKNFLQREKKREHTKGYNIPFVETKNARKIFTIASETHYSCTLSVITAEAGLGKTMAVRAYTAQHPDVILVECTPSTTAKVFFRKLLSILKSDTAGLINDMFEVAVDKLKNSGRLLIIDEAEKLPYTALELVRRLKDFAGIGILLTGMPALAGNLRGFKRQYKQLYSRVGWFYQLDELDEADTKLLFSTVFPDSNGIASIVHQYTKGSARAIENIIPQLKRLQRVNNKGINEKMIKAAVTQLMI